MEKDARIGSVSIVGAGRAGSVIAGVCGEAGIRVKGIATLHREDGERLSGKLPMKPVVRGALNGGDSWGAAQDSDCIILAVPDDEIESVTRNLVGSLEYSEMEDTFPAVVHLSGFHGVDVLGAAAEKGHPVGCIHPLRVMSVDNAENGGGGLNCPVAVEADRVLIPILMRFVKEIGGKPFVMKSGNRTAYHAAATMAANGSSVLISVAVKLMMEAGVESKLAIEGITGLVKSAVEHARMVGPDRSLTGPASRGDAETVDGHFLFLKSWEDDRGRSVGLYREITRIAVNIALDRGDLDKTAALGVLRVIGVDNENFDD